MPMSPDAFLLITLGSGALIIIIGLTIAITCSFDTLSCSGCCDKVLQIFRRRKFKRRWSSDVVLTGASLSSGKLGGGAASLVEGRPQGHGFYTAGPWSTSNDPNSAVVSTDIMQKLCLMTQMGIVGAMLTQSATSPAALEAATSSAANTLHSDKPLLTYSHFLNPGIHGNNLHQSHSELCINCNVAGYLQTNDPATLSIQQTQLNTFGGYHYDGSSVDSALSSSAEMDMDGDADADMMIMCM